MQLSFVTVDVFTDRKFGGNPVAVILDASGLDSAQMQSIAAEFNLSETAFVLPPKDTAHTAQIRIFTPCMELPFAGHPNVGTAFALGRAGEVFGRKVTDSVVFEERAGLVPIDLHRRNDVVTGARVAAPKPLSIGAEVDPQTIAATCRVDTAAVETARHPPMIISTGAPFVTAELKTRAALAGAAPLVEEFARLVPMDLAVGIQLYTTDGTSNADIETRVFVPLQGISEDPATGAANVNLIALLADRDSEPTVTLSKSISQGVDMGRPSLLQAEATKECGTVTTALIGGTCIAMMEGTLTL